MTKSPIAAASGIRRAECDGCVPAILRTALSSNVMCVFPPNERDAPPRGPSKDSAPPVGIPEGNAGNPVANVYAAWGRPPISCGGVTPISDRLPGVAAAVARQGAGLHGERDGLLRDPARQAVGQPVDGAAGPADAPLAQQAGGGADGQVPRVAARAAATTWKPCLASKRRRADPE